MISKFLLVSLARSALAFKAHADEDIGLCCLCDDCKRAVKGRGDMFINDNGMTCDTMALKMSDPTLFSDGSAKCSSMQDKYRQTCCDKSFEPTPVLQPEEDPQEEISKYPKGSEPKCDLCPDGSRPGKPNTVTAVLYMDGNPTCKDLYFMGRTGNILDRLCAPLQDYFYEPCGCGEKPSTNGNQGNGGVNQGSGGGNQGNGGVNQGNGNQGNGVNQGNGRGNQSNGGNQGGKPDDNDNDNDNNDGITVVITPSDQDTGNQDAVEEPQSNNGGNQGGAPDTDNDGTDGITIIVHTEDTSTTAAKEGDSAISNNDNLPDRKDPPEDGPDKIVIVVGEEDRARDGEVRGRGGTRNLRGES